MLKHLPLQNAFDGYKYVGGGSVVMMPIFGRRTSLTMPDLLYCWQVWVNGSDVNKTFCQYQDQEFLDTIKARLYSDVRPHIYATVIKWTQQCTHKWHDTRMQRRRLFI